MIRATRGMWRSPRQLLRASKSKRNAERSLHDLAKQENAMGGRHGHAFGRSALDAVRLLVQYLGN